MQLAIKHETENTVKEVTLGSLSDFPGAKNVTGKVVGKGDDWDGVDAAPYVAGWSQSEDQA